MLSWRPHFFTWGNLDFEVTMDLGPLGVARSHQYVNRRFHENLFGVADWIILGLVVLLFKKNPARFIVLILTVTVYLAWLLVINHLALVDLQKIYFLFIAKISLFLLAFLILLLPVLKKLRSGLAVLINFGLLFGVIVTQLLIFGKFWYQLRSLIFMIIPLTTFLVAFNATTRVSRNDKSPRWHFGIFTTFSLLFLVTALALSAGSLYILQIITEYSFRFTMFSDIYFYSACQYFLIFYATMFPYIVFVFKNKYYQEVLLNSAIANKDDKVQTAD